MERFPAPMIAQVVPRRRPSRKKVDESPHRHTKGLDTARRCTSRLRGHHERSVTDRSDPGPCRQSLAPPRGVVPSWAKSRLHSLQSGRANRKRIRLQYLTKRRGGEVQVETYFEVYRSNNPEAVRVVAMHSTLIPAERPWICSKRLWCSISTTVLGLVLSIS